MDLSLTAGALTTFWGTVFVNLLWSNRHRLIYRTKLYASKAAKYVVNKSKKIIKRSKNVQTSAASSNNQGSLLKDLGIDDNESSQNIRIQEEEQARMQKEVQRAGPQKRENRKRKRPLNLRRYTKNYEAWILRRAHLKKLQEIRDKEPTTEFMDFLKRIEEEHYDYQLTWKKKQSMQDIQDIEKYVAQQLEYDEGDDMGFVLPYDPFISDEQQSQ